MTKDGLHTDDVDIIAIINRDIVHQKSSVTRFFDDSEVRRTGV
jgi:hypothetical protein